MIFDYDRTSVKERINTETMYITINLLMKGFQKDLMAAASFFILKIIFTIMNFVSFGGIMRNIAC